MRLTWRLFTAGLWLKGPRENNLPSTLRRAAGVFPLRSGSIRSRSGIVALDKRTAHSLFKFASTRIAGIAAQIWREVAGVFTQLTSGVPSLNGNRLTFVSAPPTLSKPDYVFVAGGGNLFKIRPALDLATKWGLDPPTGSAPAIAADTLLFVTIDDMNATTNWTAGGSLFDPGTFVADVNKKVDSTASLRFRVLKAGNDDDTGHAFIDRNFTGGGLDLNTFSGSPSGDEDYIELFVAFSRPKHVKNMEITFYVGSSPPADKDNDIDTYSRELTFRVVGKKQKKRLVNLGDLLRKRDVKRFLADGALEQRDFSTAEFLSDSVVGVTRRTWTRLTISKASFDAKGSAGQTGKTWANVRALRISVESNKLGPSKVWVDRIRMIGGVGMQGDYQYMFTFFNNTTGSESNPFPTTTSDELIEGGVPATVFAPVRINDIERQGVLLGTAAGGTALPLPADPQVTHIRIWRTVGGGTNFFLVGKSLRTSTDMGGSANESFTDRVADYPGMFSGGGGTKFLQPTELADDNDRPDDTANDAVFFLGRMWITRTTTTSTQNRAWYSPIGRLEAITSYVEIGTTDEAMQKLIVWNETLFALTTKALYRLATTDEPFIFLPVQGAPGTRQPLTAQAVDAGIIYQATDSMRICDGNMTELLAEDALAPVFRTTAGASGITGMSGIASAFARGEYYISDGASNTLAWSPDGGWRNVGFACRAFFAEKDTRILLAAPLLGAGSPTYIASIEADANGEQAGEVAETTVDSGSDLAGTSIFTTFEIETGGPDTSTTYSGAGVWGVVQRLYIEGQTEGQSLTVSLVIDNTVVSIGTVSTTVGVKKVMELGIQRAGWITGVRLSATGLSKRIEISAVEADVYIPAA